MSEIGVLGIGRANSKAQSKSVATRRTVSTNNLRRMRYPELSVPMLMLWHEIETVEECRGVDAGKASGPGA